jgi:hypothetical protein
LGGHWLRVIGVVGILSRGRSTELHSILIVVRIFGWELGDVGQQDAVVCSGGSAKGWEGEAPEGEQIMHTAARAEKFRISQET